VKSEELPRAFSMKTVRLETKSITDWDSFHSEFARLMGFPDFYGHNMNAWIDCMSYLNDANAGMSKIILENGEALVINVADSEGFKKRLPEIFEALVECTAFVNQRYAEDNETSVVALAFQ